MVALALTGGVGVAAVLQQRGVAATADPDRAALVASTRASGDYVRGYTHLAEALPNAKDVRGHAVHDSVVLGTVSGVEDGAGYDELGRPGTAGHPGARVVAFDDPTADWRTLQVTLAVTETLGGTSTSTLALSWPIGGSTAVGQDATAIGRALRDLGTVVVLSAANPTGPEFLGITRQIPEPAVGLLTVAADGTLGFPFAEEGFDAAAFTDGVDTLDELRSAAALPDWTRPG